MADYTAIMNQLNHSQPFSRADLQLAMNQIGMNSSDNTVNHLIIKLLQSGQIYRTGRNQYSAALSKRIYQFPHSEFTLSVVNEIREAHPYLDFRIFELIQLNEFVNHQIAHNIVFVSVEGEFGEDVFNTLWETHQGGVLLKPSIDDLFRYMTDDMIIIVKLPTESPKGISDFWDTRIEKMLVDIAVDKLLNKIVYKGEYPAIFHDAIQNYNMDKSLMARYARRRGALDKFRTFLKTDAGLSEEEFSI